MSALASGMDAALAADRATIFGAVEIVLPGKTIRLLDGAGAVSFGGSVFTGDDPIYGVLGAITDLTDGTGDEVPAISLTLLPPNDTAAATLAAATMQGAAVKLWLGVLDPATGLVVPDPYLAFLGEVDVPTIKSGSSGREVDYEIVSVMERLFEDDEGTRLADGFHQSIWPGETGLAAVTGIEQPVYWGVDPPPGAVVGGSSGGGRSSFNRSAYL